MASRSPAPSRSGLLPGRASAFLALALPALPSLLALLVACSTRPNAGLPAPERKWRLIPESTVLGERRQFFVHGEGLDGAKVTAGPTVKVEQAPDGPDGEAIPGNRRPASGKALPVYLTVVEAIRADTALGGDKPGLRRITVSAGDTTVTLPLKVADERPR